MIGPHYAGRAHSTIVISAAQPIRVHCVLIATLCALLWAERIAGAGTPAEEERKPNIRTASAGIGTQLRLGYWVPVTAQIMNPGPDRINARLSLRTTDQSTGTTIYHREFELPPNCNRTVRITARVTRDPHQSDRVGVVQVLDADTDQLIDEKPVTAIDFRILKNVREISVNLHDPHLTVYTDESDRDYYAVKPVIESLFNRRFGLSRMLEQDWPSRWLQLDSVNVFVIGHHDPDRVTHGQWDALDRWVRSGGIVICTAGDAMATLRDSPVADWLPVHLFGSRLVNELPLEAANGTNFDVQLPNYAVVAEAQQISGDLIYQSGDLPVVVAQRRGLGCVMYMAISPEHLIVENPDDMVDLWQPLLQFTSRWRPTQHSMLDAGEIKDEVKRKKHLGIEYHLQSLIGTKVPTLKQVGWVMAVYAVALAAVPLLLKRHRLEWTWLLIIPLGAILATLVVLQGRSARESVGSATSEISIARLPTATLQQPRPLVTADGYLAMHSESGIETSLLTDSPHILVASYRSASAGTDLHLQDINAEPNYSAKPIKLDGGRVSYFQASGQVTLPRPLAVRIQAAQQGLQVTIDNPFKDPLLGAMIVYNNRPLAVGDIDPGEQVITADASELRDPGNYSIQDQLSDLDLTKKRIITDTLTKKRVTWASRRKQIQPILLAWSQEPSLGTSVEPQADATRHNTLFHVAGEWVAPAAGEPVKGFSPFINLNMKNLGAPVFDRAKNAWLRSSHDGGIDIRATPVMPVPGFKIDKADVSVSLEAINRQLEVSGVLNDGQVIPIATHDSPQGRYDIDIPDPQRFVDPTGALRVRVSVKYAGVGKAPAASMWDFKDVSLTLEGVTGD